MTEADLDAYATDAGPGGLAADRAVACTGSGAAGPARVRDCWASAAGPLLLVVILLRGRGARPGWCDGDRPRSAPLVALTVARAAAGSRRARPARLALYRLAFDHLPLFEAMREQQKWLALAVLGYAVGFGVRGGVARARTGPRPGTPRRTGRAAGALPLVMAPALLWGLGGSVTRQRVPRVGWAAGRRRPWERPGRRACSCPGTPTSRSSSPTAAPWPRPRRPSSAATILVSDAVELPRLRTDSTSLRIGVRGPDGRRRRGATGSARCWPPWASSTWWCPRTGRPEDTDWVAGQPGIEQVMTHRPMTLYRVTRSAIGRVGPPGRRLRPGRGLPRPACGTEAVLPADPGGRASAARAPPVGGITRTSPTSWSVAAGTRAGWWSRRSGPPGGGSTAAARQPDRSPGTLASEAGARRQDVVVRPVAPATPGAPRLAGRAGGTARRRARRAPHRAGRR